MPDTVPHGTDVMSFPGTSSPTPGAAAPMMRPPGAGQPAMPQGGTGAVTSPRPQMGNGAASLTLIHTAVEALQKSLVGLPMGTEIHTKVLKAITDLSKAMDSGGGDSASQIQALAAMGRDLQSNPQAAIMQKMFPQGAQNQAPAMPG